MREKSADLSIKRKMCISISMSVVKMMVSPFFLRGVCVDKAEQHQQSLPCLIFNVCEETDIDLIRPDCCGRKVYTAGNIP